MRYLILFLATGAYSGYSPIAPGTAGSVVGLFLTWALFGRLWQTSLPLFVVIFAVLFVLGCWLAGRADQIFGTHDNSRIVLDEVLGMIATMFMNPLGWRHLLAGFVLFRLFDIVKPFPAGLIDRRVGGGTGVMLDDLASAVYANLVLRALARLL